MTRFDELGLNPGLLSALAKMEYTELTPVQEQTFAPISEGRDLLAKAETGSGKTSACGIPLVQKIDYSQNTIQVLILVPTRELALQYVDEIDRVSTDLPIAPFAIFGGSDMSIQKSKLAHGVHILVATPGRLIDMLYNTDLTLKDVRTVVLDEADEMLKMGFIDDVDFIMSCMIQEHQTLFFSATMPREVMHLTEKYLKDPVMIDLNSTNSAPSSLVHSFSWLKNTHEHYHELVKYIRSQEISQAIIFSNSRHGGEKLFKHLMKDFDSVEFIHGGLEQNRRTSIFNRFKRKEIKYMVATDVAGRGLDFSHVTHVINFEFPRNIESYTHRTGRTGRMGRKGLAMTFVSNIDFNKFRHLIKHNNISPIWDGQEPDIKRPAKRHPADGSAEKGRFRKPVRKNPKTPGNTTSAPSASNEPVSQVQASGDTKPRRSRSTRSQVNIANSAEAGVQAAE
ncbi:MAG: DEAD/DEAH box helicase [Sedimentisphaerales bacterium]|nr:DEAD/DEAH box helicase [Sedimentisphaerales bacterium]MBN2843778.1 DEAD/DEAH box helicase [Sedimentisphaerales bacterium]